MENMIFLSSAIVYVDCLVDESCGVVFAMSSVHAMGMYTRVCRVLDDRRMRICICVFNGGAVWRNVPGNQRIRARTEYC